MASGRVCLFLGLLCLISLCLADIVSFSFISVEFILFQFRAPLRPISDSKARKDAFICWIELTKHHVYNIYYVLR